MGGRCWWEQDGGWADECWKLWTICGERVDDPLTGSSKWVVDWVPFDIFADPEMLADFDDKRELGNALRMIQQRMQNPTAALLDEEDD